MGEVTSYTKDGIDAITDLSFVDAAVVGDQLVLTRGDNTTLEVFLPSEVTQETLDAAIAAIVDSSPETLNTLNELAAAIGDDANFATNVLAAIAALEAETASLDTRVDTLEANVPVGADVGYLDHGDVSTSTDLIWGDGNILQRVRLTAATVGINLPTDVPPDEVHRLLLELVQDATGGRAVTLGGSFPPELAASDDFNRADAGSVVGSSTPVGNKAWAGSGWPISGNRLQSSGGPVVVDLGGSNQEVSWTIPTFNNTVIAGSGHVMRCSADRTQYVWFRCGFKQGGGDQQGMGVFTVPGFASQGFYPFLIAPGDVITVSVDGANVYSIKKNGVEVATFTLSHGNSNTWAGVSSNGGADGSFWDDFEAYISGSVNVIDLVDVSASLDNDPGAQTIFELLTRDGGATWVVDRASGKLTKLEHNTQTGAAYTLLASDQGKIVEMNNAGANTLTVPPNSSVPFPIGTVITIRQIGAGQTTVAEGAGVDIVQRENKLKLAGQWAEASLVKRDTNQWVLVGDVSA